MFQGHPQSLPVSFPFKGINTNSQDDTDYSRFIQNILVSDNKTGALRYGTSLVSSFSFDANRTFKDRISVMSFLKQDGTSEKLVYVQYLGLSFLQPVHIIIIDDLVLEGYCEITIDLTAYNPDQVTYLKKVLFDGVYLFFRQTISDGAEIENLTSTNVEIKFNLPFRADFFDVNYSVFIERAGIYRVNTDNSYELIEDDLDPAVIVSHVNFQGNLLIANGVESVKVYDGLNLLPLKAPVPIPNITPIVINNQVLSFSIPQVAHIEIQTDVNVGDGLTLVSDVANQECNITAITFAPPANNLVAVTITVDVAPQANIRKIIYQKLCPSFSFLAIVHKRLWALPEGRPYQNKFRPPLLAMRVYYAAKLESIYDWFNQKTNQIDFINMASTSNVPDNLEAISSFEGKTLFLGRETTQVWTGEDPTTLDDGQNIALPDFKWEQTLPVGAIQQTLFLEVPNNFIFLSKYGIVSISSINLYQQLQVSYQFSTPIDHYINNQLSFIETDRDFRSMRAFLYPYGRFLGFRIKYSCFIYQLNNEGAWVVFSENFAESTSILYDPTSKNLYLGSPNGNLLVYADKINGQSYNEYGKGELSWFIAYNWTYFQSAWTNTDLYIDSKSLEPLTIKVRIYLNQDETISINENIEIQKRGVLYDVSQFGQKPYPFNETTFSHEIIKFTADSLMIELSGLGDDLFVFNKLFLAGGNINPNNT